MKNIFLLTILVVIHCQTRFAFGRHKPPTDATEDERPVSASYYLGTATILTKRSLIQNGSKAKGSIVISYDTTIPELPVMHTTAWILDGANASVEKNWVQVSPIISHPEKPAQPVAPTKLDPGDYYIQFWAQTANDVPPERLKVTVESGVETVVIVSYKSLGKNFRKQQSKPRKANSLDDRVHTRDTGLVSLAGNPSPVGVASGYGQLRFVDAANHSTSWSIDGGGWRSMGTAVNVYAGVHTIQFRANTAGSVAPPPQSMAVSSRYLYTYNVSYH